MARFQTNMKEWDGAYAPPSTIETQKSDPWGELAAKLIPGAIDAIGEGYATAKGANILGTSTTAEEAQEAVKDFDTEVPFTDDPSNTPDQAARISDMKTEALKKFGTNDKKIQALVSAGKISSLEANAKRHQMLQENLSNPVLAMFKDEFMEAAKPFTGGPGLTEQFFGAYMPTEEERAKLVAMEDIVKSKAQEEVAVQGMVRMGMSENAARETYQSDLQQARKVAALEEKSKIRKFESPEAFQAGTEVLELFGREIGGKVAEIVSSGRTLSPQEIAQFGGSLEQAKLEYMNRLAPYKASLMPDDYKSLISSFNSQVDNYNNMLKTKDGQEFAKKSIDLYLAQERSQEASSNAWLRNNLGHIYTLYKFSPDLANTVVGAASDNVAAEYKASKNIVVQKLMTSLGIPLSKETLGSTSNKLGNGEKDFTLSESANFMSTLWGSGSKGVKAEMDLSRAKPEEHYTMLNNIYKQEGATLDPYRSRDWSVAADTEEGANALAVPIRAMMANARSIQVRTGSIPSVTLMMEAPKASMDILGQEASEPGTYKFNAKLDNRVAKNIVDSVKLIENKPLVMKALGVSSVPEFVAKYFSEEALGK